MTKKLRLLISSISLLIIAISIFTLIAEKENKQEKLILEEQRAQHAKVLANSPFKETLTWDKNKRKLEGLPPNRYFEQMWELTINPSTGKLDQGNISVLREELIQRRLTLRNPGQAGNDWEERGPNDIGGRTRAILFDPNEAVISS